MNLDLLESLLAHKTETDYLDFKKTIYRKEQYEELLKDVIGMANAVVDGSRYIVMGVKQDERGTCIIHGIEEHHCVDPSTFHQLFFENIEPTIKSEVHYISYQKQLLAVLEIKSPMHQPYMMKKQFGKLHIGACFVRRNTSNGFALRSDFERFYKQQPFEMRILTPILSAVDVKNGCAFLECSFRNLTDFPMTIKSGLLEVLSDSNVRSKHYLFGYEKEFLGTDYRLYLLPKTEICGNFLFGFNSSDCLRLGMDEYGCADESFQFQLTLIDTTEKKYTITVDDCDVYAKGDFLWKVRDMQREL